PVDQIEESTAAWLRSLYAPATRELGARRWGFKEVQHDAEVADFLTRLFPRGRVILLVRNPVDVIASMRSRSWYHSDGGGPHGVLKVWSRNVQSFLDAGRSHLLVRYEDLVARPEATCTTLE